MHSFTLYSLILLAFDIFASAAPTPINIGATLDALSLDTVNLGALFPNTPDISSIDLSGDVDLDAQSTASDA